jgi:hypothetical protein
VNNEKQWLAPGEIVARPDYQTLTMPFILLPAPDNGASRLVDENLNPARQAVSRRHEHHAR